MHIELLETLELFEEISKDDPVVFAAIKSAKCTGGNEVEQLKFAIVQLVANRELLKEELFSLDAIAPKLFEAEDGRLLRYDAPTSFIKKMQRSSVAGKITGPASVKA